MTFPFSPFIGKLAIDQKLIALDRENGIGGSFSRRRRFGFGARLLTGTGGDYNCKKEQDAILFHAWVSFVLKVGLKLVK